MHALDNRGKFEWSGDWSDNSDLWKKHPNVQVEMGLISGQIIL